MRTLIGIFGCVAGLTLCVSSANAGILYATQLNGTNGAIIDTDANTVIGTFTTTSLNQTGIAVGATLRAIPSNTNTPGSEYDLAGNVINTGIYSSAGFNSLYDGTTDGAYNYAVDHNGNGTQTVFRFDLNWANPTALFNTQNRSSGITYDANTNTLWTTESLNFRAPNGFVRQYDLAGNMISEFNKGTFSAYGLAWDGTDDTLWMSNSANNSLYQYQKDGTFLGSSNFGGQLFSYAFGLEFQSAVVSEPAALGLFGLGLVGLGLAARRRKVA